MACWAAVKFFPSDFWFFSTITHLLFLFLFLFWRKKNLIFINQQKLLSLSTSWVTSLGMSSNHIRGAWKNFAIFASLSATPFPLCLPWEKEIDLKYNAMLCESLMIWPNGARHGGSIFMDFMTFSESPSTITDLIPSSLTKHTALRHARASATSTACGRSILSYNAPSALPDSSRITTLIPAVWELWKMALSKFTLRVGLRGGIQWVGCGSETGVVG